MKGVWVRMSERDKMLRFQTDNMAWDRLGDGIEEWG